MFRQVALRRSHFPLDKSMPKLSVLRAIVRSDSVRHAGYPLTVLGALAVAGFAASAVAQERDLPQSSSTKWRLDLEYQRFDTVTNFIRKGNDGTGTQFEATDYTGSKGNEGRVSAFVPVNWFWKGDELRFVIAPFQQSGTATPTTPILFDGGLFRAGVPLTVLYKFNTYRITYDAPIFESLRDDGWEFRLGGTLAVRDAQIKLSQPGIERNFPNWGPVPLLYFGAAKDLGAGWHLLGEFDAFPAPGGGGLFDGSLKAAYDLSPGVALTVGARYQFGGATGSDFYNFLREWAGVVGVNFTF
jgi:hypothetical protein